MVPPQCCTVVNSDPEIGDRLKIVYLENYRVSLAEKGTYEPCLFVLSEKGQPISVSMVMHDIFFGNSSHSGVQ